jgi:MFS family permease
VNRTLLQVVLPLAALTAVGLLATDLYLPALPLLPAQFDGTIAAAQATLAAFMGALALSQLLWGVAADRFGGRAILRVAIALQVAAGAGCALAPSLPALTALRALQGLGVGAATVIVPTLIRQRFADAEVVRAMSWLGIAESLVPAIGPIAGALLLQVAPWRASFWIVALMTAALAPFALRTVPRAAPSHADAPPGGYYGQLLRDRRYLGYALGHALCFGALLGFVASAPQLVAIWLGAGPLAFALLQALGVSAFIACASQSGRLSERHGIDRLILIGVALQVVAAVSFMAQALAAWRSLAALTATWVLFCAALGLRGPPTMARALGVHPALVGRAAGLLMFMALGISAAATQSVAPFLARGLLPVAWMSVALTVASALAMGIAVSRPRSA